jgi:hypothetical protein
LEVDGNIDEENTSNRIRQGYKKQHGLKEILSNYDVKLTTLQTSTSFIPHHHHLLPFSFPVNDQTSNLKTFCDFIHPSLFPQLTSNCMLLDAKLLKQKQFSEEGKSQQKEN